LRGIVVIGVHDKATSDPSVIRAERKSFLWLCGTIVDSMPVETSSSMIKYRPLLIPYGVQSLRNEHLNTIETATNDR
jgi:hypothetical protein